MGRRGFSGGRLFRFRDPRRREHGPRGLPLNSHSKFEARTTVSAQDLREIGPANADLFSERGSGLPGF